MTLRSLLCSTIMIHFLCGANAQTGRLEKLTFFSPVLGIEKSFNIYFPASYDDCEKAYPVLYLFRGHEDEWKNRGNILDLVNQAMEDGEIGEMIIVLPGLTFGESFIGFPVNMRNPGPPDSIPDLGSGQFEDYVIQDMIPYVDKEFRTISTRQGRATDGFSAGAYASIFIAFKHPGLFCSAGGYDGIQGYLDFDDPSRPGEYDDSIFMNLDYFDSYFGKPREMEHMMQCNPANMIRDASPDQLKELKQLDLYIRAACDTAKSAFIEGSYLPRNKQLVEVMNDRGLQNHWRLEDLVFFPGADHSWSDAQKYIRATLPLHWKNFIESHPLK